MSKLEELKKEATDLGLSFNANIGEAKLAEKIEAYYKSQETSKVEVKQSESVKKAKSLGERVKEAEEAARKTRIVTIVDNDQRENNLTTTVSVTCGNEHFELGLMRIPLNEPVEVMQGFIDVLKEIKIPMHVVDRKTGLTRTVLRNRYSISYEDDLKK
jgi:mRNA-degrading endonuclease toxin of MazEF toxin-antitoxin module